MCIRDRKITGKLDVTTSLTVTSNATLNGNVLLGSDDSDDISFNGKVNTNILPDSDEDFNLGSENFSWKQVHAKEYYGTFKGIIDPGTSDDKIQKGNTKAQVVDDDDTGPEGYFFVQTGGTERLRVDKDGNVGIGTTNPDHELQIHGDEPRLRITHDGSTNPLNSFYVRVDSDGVEFDSYQEVTGTRRPFIFTQYQKERLRITEGGGVGIGTTDPNSDMTGKTDTTLAVAGIVTANEYYGEFKGSIDPGVSITCLLYTSPSPRDRTRSRMPSSA